MTAAVKRRRPLTLLHLAMDAASRRRYGYAALRVLRRGARRAVAEDVRRSLSGEPYASELDELVRVYGKALRWALDRWPSLRLDDERSEP